MTDKNNEVETELLKKLMDVLSKSDSLHVQVSYLENKDIEIRDSIKKIRYELYGNGTPGIIHKIDSINDKIDRISKKIDDQDKKEELAILERKKNVKKIKFWVAGAIGSIVVTALGALVTKHINHQYDEKIEKKILPVPLETSSIDGFIGPRPKT